MKLGMVLTLAALGGIGAFVLLAPSRAALRDGELVPGAGYRLRVAGQPPMGTDLVRRLLAPLGFAVTSSKLVGTIKRGVFDAEHIVEVIATATRADVLVVPHDGGTFVVESVVPL